jgi:hypothetical protein
MSCPSQSTQFAEFHNVIITTQLVQFLVISNSPASPVHHWAVNPFFLLSFLISILTTSCILLYIRVYLAGTFLRLASYFWSMSFDHPRTASGMRGGNLRGKIRESHSLRTANDELLFTLQPLKRSVVSRVD